MLTKSTPQRLLQEKILEKTRAHSSFSLRAFARAAGLSHTPLSLFLKGKRPLSQKSAFKLCQYLDLTPHEIEILHAGTRKGKGVNDPFPPQTHQTHDLTLEEFALIKEWHHYGILSALELPRAKLDAIWLSRVLKIPKIEADQGIERLFKLGLLKRTKTGWKQAGAPLRVQSPRLHEASRIYYRELLKKAESSIDTSPRKERTLSSTVFAMDLADMEWAQKEIKTFQRRLVHQLETKSKRKTGRKAVTCIAVQLFPLSKTVSTLPLEEQNEE